MIKNASLYPSSLTYHLTCFSFRHFNLMNFLLHVLEVLRSKESGSYVMRTCLTAGGI